MANDSQEDLQEMIWRQIYEGEGGSEEEGEEKRENDEGLV